MPRPLKVNGPYLHLFWKVGWECVKRQEMCDALAPVFALIRLCYETKSSSTERDTQGTLDPGTLLPFSPLPSTRCPAQAFPETVACLTHVSPGPSQMSWRPQYRSSKFRNVYGKVANREHCFDGIPITKNVHDNHFCAVNARFLAIVTESAGGGSFLVIPLEQVRARTS